MRVLCSLIVVLLAVPAAWACIPEDADRAAEVAFDNNEVFDLTKLTALGTEDVNYRIEDREKDELFPSDQPVVVYQSHSDERVMVKVGFSLFEYDWRSVLIVLPEGMAPEAFDFASAMQEELVWLLQLGVISGLGAEQIPAITQDLAPRTRFFTEEMVLSFQNYFTPEEAVFCTGAAVYTQLPPVSLGLGTSVEARLWGRIKACFR
ncbi:MAG: hypothetical protein KAJ05_06090 [Candidatus Latescibacteria bacterium]|nr:hypothetical protein [Candidatus Latescibacterota bacterium]